MKEKASILHKLDAWNTNSAPMEAKDAFLCCVCDENYADIDNEIPFKLHHTETSTGFTVGQSKVYSEALRSLLLA